jgi:hypothetical protein
MDGTYCERAKRFVRYAWRGFDSFGRMSYKELFCRIGVLDGN